MQEKSTIHCFHTIHCTEKGNVSQETFPFFKYWFDYYNFYCLEESKGLFYIKLRKDFVQ